MVCMFDDLFSVARLWVGCTLCGLFLMCCLCGCCAMCVMQVLCDVMQMFAWGAWPNYLLCLFRVGVLCVWRPISEALFWGRCGCGRTTRYTYLLQCSDVCALGALLLLLCCALLFVPWCGGFCPCHRGCPLSSDSVICVCVGSIFCWGVVNNYSFFVSTCGCLLAG